MPAAEHQQQFDQQDHADGAADRQITQHAAAQFGEIDIEHHHHEEEQHRDGADIDDDQDQRQEFGAHEDEEARRIEEGQDQEQDRMNGIAR